MSKKYELVVDDTITFWGWKLFRIRALISFGSVAAGELGGYIQKKENLSQEDDAWVWGNAKVGGDAKVSDLGDVIIFKNHWSSGRHFTYTKSNKKWKVGCFYGTGQELIDKAYQDSDNSGNYYKAYVEFVEKLEALDESERP